MSPKPQLFFIHGLNTFGDDLFHAGPLTFGPMWQHLKRELEPMVEFYSCTQMGYGSFESQVSRALTQLRPRLNGSPVHLFGHSMGGLVARGVAHELPGVRSVMTIGTPHAGTNATEGALDLQIQSPALFRALQLFGYDIEKRREPLSHFTVAEISAWTSRLREMPGVDNVSFVGSAPRRLLGLPFHPIYSKIHPEREASDGLIHAASQRWARDGGTFVLDHFAQLGAFTQPWALREVRSEFARLIETVKHVIRTNSQ